MPSRTAQLSWLGGSSWGRTSLWGIEVSRREGGLRAAWAVLGLASVIVYVVASTPSLGEPEQEIMKCASMEKEPGEVALHVLHVLSLILVVLCCALLSCSGCLTLGDPMDCGPTGSSVHGIIQARMPEWVAVSFPRGSSQPRDQTHVPCIFHIGRQILYHHATWEAPNPRYHGNGKETHSEDWLPSGPVRRPAFSPPPVSGAYLSSLPVPLPNTQHRSEKCEKLILT